MTTQTQDGYELFRRAIVLRDEDAWAAIYACYRPLLVAWAHRCTVRQSLDECPQDLADQALARAWAALTPERFADFASLARLLAYLRACVTTTAIDCARARAQSRTLQLDLIADTRAAPEHDMLAALDRAVVWRAAIECAANIAERVVLIEHFVYGLPPRAIHARHPQLFAQVAQVYGAKRNLCARLQRNPALLQLREQELVDAEVLP
jgi:DNA-directed RNA polymerase specialized sigma24 family protein